MTELGGGIAATDLEDSEEHQSETVGRPMPGMEVRVVDEDRKPLPTGTVGELACKSESIMMGFFGENGILDPNLDGEGWFYTGDLAVVDEKGYIRIVGRKKDLIIRGGQNIYPAKIENALTEMDEVREAAAVGIPDPRSGESVCLFVIPDTGKNLDEGMILDYCRHKLEVFEIPQKVKIVEEFPRSTTGKPKKNILQQMILNEVQDHGE
jgi:fatty-acyl-CoA synthase/long-chain acyl-CoA synthetase